MKDICKECKRYSDCLLMEAVLEKTKESMEAVHEKTKDKDKNGS